MPRVGFKPMLLTIPELASHPSRLPNKEKLYMPVLECGMPLASGMWHEVWCMWLVVCDICCGVCGMCHDMWFIVHIMWYVTCGIRYVV